MARGNDAINDGSGADVMIGDAGQDTYLSQDSVIDQVPYRSLEDFWQTQDPNDLVIV